MNEPLENKVKRLERWVADLQKDCYVNCVYCGHRYGHVKEVPVSMADVLKEHIKCCPAHPMNEYRRALEIIRDADLPNFDAAAGQAILMQQTARQALDDVG